MAWNNTVVLLTKQDYNPISDDYQDWKDHLTKKENTVRKIIK